MEQIKMYGKKMEIIVKMETTSKIKEEVCSKEGV